MRSASDFFSEGSITHTDVVSNGFDAALPEICFLIRRVEVARDRDDHVPNRALFNPREIVKSGLRHAAPADYLR